MVKKKGKRTAKKLKVKAKERTGEANDTNIDPLDPSAVSSNHQLQNNELLADLEVPQQGWIQERHEAKKAFKENSSQTNFLRLARAYHKLRQFDKLTTLLQPQLTSGDIDNALYKKTLSEWMKDAQCYLSLDTQLNDPDYGFTEENLREHNIDTWLVEHGTYNNLNLLHFAAEIGDIRLLEKAIALGAAIDMPVGETTGVGFRGVPAPYGSTALLLCLSNLALYGQTPRISCGEILAEQLGLVKALKGISECALQLIKLGANLDVRYDLNSCPPSEFTVMHQEMGLDNKNALQLATLSQNTELVDAMKQFQSEENRVALVHCRCGSRLPWKECHAALDDEPHFCTSTNNNGRERMCWRYSPMANCFCDLGKTTYYNCCWKDQAKYQIDEDGKLFHRSALLLNALTRDHILSQYRAMEAAGARPDDLLFPDITKEKVLEALKYIGFDIIFKMIDPEGKSKIPKEWDQAIYVGIMERIENWFGWTDLHWHLPKAELIQRSREWNEALGKYCDDMGLVGKKRQQAIKIHTASPLAPCANPGCNKFEVEVKGFAKCSRCKRVAYCSVKCQKAHWKSHKALICCVPVGPCNEQTAGHL